MRTFALSPGAVVPCAVWDDDELMALRLRAEFGGVSEVTLLQRVAGSEVNRATGQVAASSHGEIICAVPASWVRQLPVVAVEVLLTAHEGDEERRSAATRSSMGECCTVGEPRCATHARIGPELTAGCARARTSRDRLAPARGSENATTASQAVAARTVVPLDCSGWYHLPYSRYCPGAPAPISRISASTTVTPRSHRCSGIECPTSPVATGVDWRSIREVPYEQPFSVAVLRDDAGGRRHGWQCAGERHPRGGTLAGRGDVHQGRRADSAAEVSVAPSRRFDPHRCRSSPMRRRVRLRARSSSRRISGRCRRGISSGPSGSSASRATCR